MFDRAVADTDESFLFTLKKFKLTFDKNLGIESQLLLSSQKMEKKQSIDSFKIQKFKFYWYLK